MPPLNFQDKLFSTAINSPIVNTIVKIAISKLGKLVRIVVTALIGHLASTGIFNPADINTFQDAFMKFGMTLVALAYGWFEYWLNARRLQAAKVVQVGINAQLSPMNQIPVDGMIGNATLAGLDVVTPIEVRKAVAVVQTGKP